MTFYDGIYPFYPTARAPVVFNTILIVVIIIFLVFLTAFLIILIGIRGAEKLHWFVRITLSLFVGGVIVAVNFTNDWEIGYTIVNTTYKSFSHENVKAEVGVHVGFKGVNITLRGLPENQLNEIINYNEEFLWVFGLNYESQYHSGLERGLPDPILYIAEKFTPSSPCGVYSQYRVSGQYASATMWVALCAWMLSNILLWLLVFLYGGYMILVTGLFMIFSLISFGTTRHTPLCAIQFDDSTLKSGLGPSFWLTLATALLCLIIGTAIVAMSIFKPATLNKFFLVNASNNEEENCTMYYNHNTSETDKPVQGVPLERLEKVV
ncbi:dual oxidase maturation factor 1-like [Scyliorhinus canicula]|uniref:dual oxidase maturation factor 1-like n=1 Tax=Scyliorhinus canicula TaxID=7830 RepID=UPI0018F4C5B8|nr:dual oxidase maturation factor 1-like [Scyliorhinus canicula]XP_038640355.1 dual oxidase maturation factor 1-like [Scyliorhinus canicula]